MPKLKTRKSVAKRVRVTKSGKILRNKPGRRHILSSKTSKRKRHLRKATLVNGAYSHSFTVALHQ